jgi:transcription initiation factor TFIID subunit 6
MAAQQPAMQRQQVQPALAETIQTIVAQLGLPPLQSECAITMAPSVEYHLREVIQEASKFMRHSKRTTLLTRDVNNALRSMGIEQLFGFSSSEPLRFVKHERPGIFTVHDPLLRLDAVVNQPLPACPVEPTLGAHWMSIEGVQPAIPENPQAQPSGVGPAAAASVQEGATGAQKIESEDSKVVPRVKHVLSRELQLYYDSVTEAITQGTRVQQDAALKSLGSDAGFQELVPYLTLFVSDTVTHSLRNLDLLHVLMRGVHALLDNPHVALAPYIHQLVPAILTCVVGKRLCAEPLENHWKLRDYAAELVALLCEKFGPSFDTLQPRITKTLLGAFTNAARPRTTHYGRYTHSRTESGGGGREVVRKGERSPTHLARG